MDAIKPATLEQIEAIKETADLIPGSQVWAMGPSIAVVRPVVEVDPVYYNNVSHSKMALFIWGLENILKGEGVSRYYFQVDAKDEVYRKIVEGYGAEATNEAPEIRYRKIIL